MHRYKEIKKILFSLSKKQTAYLLSGFFIVLIFIYYQLFVSSYIEDRILNSAISSTISIFFLAFLLFAVYMFATGVTNAIDSALKQEQLLQLQAYTSNLEIMYDDTRISRHECINIIAPMYGLIEANDISGLEKYFTTQVVPISESMKSKNNALDRLKNIHIWELKGTLSLKLMQAQNKGIQVDIEVGEKIEKINFDVVLLARITGILIDNAVEACLEAEKPVLRLALFKEGEKGRVTVMLITNSFKEPLPPLTEMFRDGFSTKGEKRGLGLHMVRQIMDQSERASINTYVEGGEFIQKVKFSD